MKNGADAAAPSLGTSNGRKEIAADKGKTDASSPLLDSALEYARLGWHVFPVKTRGKQPLTKHGFKDATTDESQIQQWWSRWPTANIGVATEASRLVVVDVDPRNGGRKSFSKLGPEREFWGTVQTKTGGGGGHFFYRAAGNQPVKSGSEAFGLPGIDIKAKGGYVVAPPSVHPSGKRYEWADGGRLGSCQVRGFPAELRNLLQGATKKTSSQPKTHLTPKIVTAGKRNEQLIRLIGKSIEVGLTKEMILASAKGWNEKACQPCLPDQEVESTVDSAWHRYGPDSKPHLEIKIGQGVRIVDREDAIYRVKERRLGNEETAIIAKPFEFVRIVEVEGEERIDLRIPEPISGTFDQVANHLNKSGRFLEPNVGRPILAHMRHYHRRNNGVGRGRETFELFTDEEGNLEIPETCYPEPGINAEEYSRIQQILDVEPPEDMWRAYLEFEGHLTPKEITPAKAACAIAPISRLLRANRYIVAAPYLLSTNPGVGKTKTAEAYSSFAWNVDLQSGEDLSSDFRFAHYLNGPATTLAVDEAEKFDWRKYGANIKKALESEKVTVRGTSDLGIKGYASRRIPIFTSNHLPPLPRPTLARLKVVRFDEERTRASRSARQSFDNAIGRLGPVGPALARAWVDKFQTLSALTAAIEARAGEIEDVYGSFTENRRAKSWAIDLVALETWEHASGGIHTAPDVQQFIEQVVTPGEIDTFAAQQDRLASFRAWFDRWRAENTRYGMDGSWITGYGDIWDELPYRSPKTHIEHAGYRVTRAILDAFNGDPRVPQDAHIDALTELARLVLESFKIPREELLDKKGTSVRCQDIGRRQRAVWIPAADPEVFNEQE